MDYWSHRRQIHKPLQPRHKPPPPRGLPKPPLQKTIDYTKKEKDDDLWEIYFDKCIFLQNKECMYLREKFAYKGYGKFFEIGIKCAEKKLQDIIREQEQYREQKRLKVIRVREHERLKEHGLCCHGSLAWMCSFCCSSQYVEPHEK